MNITREEPKKVFHPVSITFETLDELKRFVTYEGKALCNEGGIPFYERERLSDIVDEYAE